MLILKLIGVCVTGPGADMTDLEDGISDAFQISTGSRTGRGDETGKLDFVEVVVYFLALWHEIVVGLCHRTGS